MKIIDIINESNVIDLKGPQGNAYFLLGTAKKLAKDLNLDYDKIQKEMTACNYDNLVDVFKKYFGEYVDVRENKLGMPRMNKYNIYTTKSKDGDFQAWQGEKHLGTFKTIQDLDKFLNNALNSGKIKPQE